MKNDPYAHQMPAAPSQRQMMASRSDTFAEMATHLNALDIAQIVMLVDCGVVDPELGVAALTTLLSVDPSQFYRHLLAGNTHPPAEAAAPPKSDSAAADLIHWALSPAERDAVVFRLDTRAQLLKLMEANYQLREALIRFAESHQKHTVLVNPPGGSAGLTTLGHWALMLDSSLTRDSERLVALYNRLNRSPAGAFEISGSDQPINRLRTAELLGFDGLAENTFDALQSADLRLECASAHMILAHNLARLADDLLLWSGRDQGVMTFPNWFRHEVQYTCAVQAPVGLHDLRGLATRAMTVMTTIVTDERGPTGASLYLRGLNQTVSRDLSDDLIALLSLMARVIDEIDVKPQRALEIAHESWASGFDLLRLFQDQAGLTPAQAQSLTTQIVSATTERGTCPSQLTTEDVRQMASLSGLPDVLVSQQILDQALDPSAYIARRDVLGSAGPEAMAAGLRSAQSRIRLGRSRLADRHRSLSDAERNRRAAAEELLSNRSN